MKGKTRASVLLPIRYAHAIAAFPLNESREYEFNPIFKYIFKAILYEVSIPITNYHKFGVTILNNGKFWSNNQAGDYSIAKEAFLDTIIWFQTVKELNGDKLFSLIEKEK